MTTTTGVLCIDADGHVRDTDEDIRGYLDAPYNERPRLSGGAPRDGFDNTLGNRAGTRVVDTAVWIDALDRGGLDASVLYPTGSLVSGWLREPDFADARARAYNNWLFDTYLKVDSRFKGVAMLPVQDPAAAAVELRRAVNELGMLGGMLPEGPYLFGKPEFDVLYEEAERLGVPLAVHASGRITGSYDEFLFDNLAQVHSLGHAFVQMKQFVSIVLSGVPEKFPALKLAFLEAGCGWAVFMLDRMDERYHIRGHGGRAAPHEVTERVHSVRQPLHLLRGGRTHASGDDAHPGGGHHHVRLRFPSLGRRVSREPPASAGARGSDTSAARQGGGVERQASVQHHLEGAPMYDLSGKVALVTGAGGQRGFGRAIANRLAEEGADVAVNDVALNPYGDAGGWHGLEEVASEIAEKGRKSLALVGDVSDSGSVERTVGRSHPTLWTHRHTGEQRRLAAGA